MSVLGLKSWRLSGKALGVCDLFQTAKPEACDVSILRT